MCKDLSHLSEAETTTLMDRYYAGEKASVLVDEYQLSILPSMLCRSFPPEPCANETCNYCGEQLVRTRLSYKYRAENNKKNMYCPTCDHRPYDSTCKCKNCIEAENELRKHRENLIKERYTFDGTPVDFHSLSFEQKVFLGALWRSLGKENLFEINPQWDSNVVLAPTGELASEMYKELYQNRIIGISPTSPIEAFILDDSFPKLYYIFGVTYYLNLAFPQNKLDLFTEMLMPSYYTSEFTQEALCLWRKIAVHECIEYLNYQMEKVYFQFEAGNKTYKTFEILLNDFSVSQIYGIIRRAVADASKLYLERNMTKKHAANTVIGACERYAERAKINGWNLTKHHRIPALPESALSAFFFNRVLGIGERGFYHPPTIYEIDSDASL